MKRLKFMLAAAAAIGLTTASQAYNGSTNFETGALTDDLFEFTGAAGDNESAIVEEAVSYSALCGRPREFQGTAQTKILQVSTGTDPLLRKIGTSAENVAEGAIYVDTLVQFTVTPSSDDVTTNENDKLLIYLKEGNGATNLMVKAAAYTPADAILTTPELIVPTDVAVSSDVVPNRWYRLTVRSSVVECGALVFNIWLDGTQLTLSNVLLNDGSDDLTAFPSLLGTDTTLAAVGFAGEGKVDDLSFTQADPFFTPVDFTLNTVSGVSYTVNDDTYTFTAPEGSVISAFYVGGSNIVAAAGQTSYTWTATADDAGSVVIVSATKQLTAAEHPWYENPEAVVLAENLPTQAATGPSAFHGQGQDEYLGLTFGTNPLQFNLYQVDSTNALTELSATPSNYFPTVGLEVAGLRGVAVSKTLGIAMTLAYATTTTMYAFPLDGNGGAPVAVTKPSNYAFDAAAFSPDGKYLFSNVVSAPEGNTHFVKWSVAVSTNGIALTKVGTIAAGGRGRSLAYGRINGRDLVFATVESGKVAVLDMTGDVAANWTAADLITALPTISYGSLCLSGIYATGATPTLTVATSVNNDNSADVLNTYTLTVPAADAADPTVSATLTNSFDQAAMAKAGFGTLVTNMYGNTVYVTDDNKTIYFARADRKLYAAEWAPVTWATYLGAAVDGAYEIDNLAELKAFQANVGVLPTAGETFKLTADIALDDLWPGIGLQNGKDKYTTAQFEEGAFQGTFDGQNHTISNFQMVNGLDYCGFFNSITNATIQNLKIGYAGNLVTPGTSNAGSGSGETVGTFVGVANSSTLRNLTSLAGSVTCWKGFGGIVGFVTAGTLVESCTNNVNLTSIKPNKAGGIAIITQGLTGTATFRNCQNNGTTTGSNETGGLVGYIGQNTAFENCESTVAYKLFHHQGYTVTVSGMKGSAAVLAYSGAATPGLNFATVDNGVATFVADNALALDGEYKVMASGATATFEFAEAGTIAFDTALATPTYAVTLSSGITGLTLSDATEGTVTTYTAAASGSPIHPGEQTETTYTTQADAEAALTTVNNSIAASSAVVTALGQVATEAYLTNFTAKVVEVSGGYKVEVGLTAGAEAFLQAEANDDAAAMIEDVTAPTITINTMPGFYYSIKSGSTLSGMTEGDRTLATGGTLTINRPQLPLGATSGFYKVLINIGPKQD